MEIEELLARSHAQPVAIYFCSGVLSDPNPIGVKRWYYNDYEKKITMEIDPKTCDNHTVILYGRRLGKNGVPQFLIRNSWGTYCPSSWTNSFAQCETHVVKGKKVNTGDLWVDEGFLMRATYGHVYLDNGP